MDFIPDVLPLENLVSKLSDVNIVSLLLFLTVLIPYVSELWIKCYNTRFGPTLDVTPFDLWDLLGGLIVETTIYSKNSKNVCSDWSVFSFLRWFSF